MMINNLKYLNSSQQQMFILFPVFDYGSVVSLLLTVLIIVQANGTASNWGGGRVKYGKLWSAFIDQSK